MEDNQTVEVVAVYNCRDESGAKHKPGKKFTCGGELAQKLYANGSAKFASESLLSDTTPADTGSKDDDIGATDGPQTIADAISELISKDPERKVDTYWTKKGPPQVRAIENILNTDVSAEDVSAAWEEFESNG